MGKLSSRRGKLTAGIAGFTAVAVVALVLVLTAGPATAKQFATLHILAGTVEVDQGQGFTPGAELQTLREGDTVRTGSDGRAEVEYFDGSATRLDYDTTFRIKQLESFPDKPGSKVIVGEQEEGQTFNRVVALTGSESRFETETPTASASVQGTDYVVKVLPDGSTEYWVLSGEIVLTTPEGDEITVSAGEGVVINEDGTIGEVFELTEEQLNDGFVDFNQCVLDGVEECVEGEVVTPDEPEASPSPEPSPT
ncbi:MAG: FecR family protein, partial [Actinomycetota bacterium]